MLIYCLAFPPLYRLKLNVFSFNLFFVFFLTLISYVNTHILTVISLAFIIKKLKLSLHKLYLFIYLCYFR